MSSVKVHKDARAITRSELITELRGICDELESVGQFSFGTGESVAVPQAIYRELELERSKDGAELKLEIEIKWAAEVAAAVGEAAGVEE